MSTGVLCTLFEKLTVTCNQLPDNAIYVPLSRKTPRECIPYGVLD